MPYRLGEARRQIGVTAHSFGLAPSRLLISTSALIWPSPARFPTVVQIAIRERTSNELFILVREWPRSPPSCWLLPLTRPVPSYTCRDVTKKPSNLPLHTQVCGRF